MILKLSDFMFLSKDIEWTCGFDLSLSSLSPPLPLSNSYPSNQETRGLVADTFNNYSLAVWVPQKFAIWLALAGGFDFGAST